jgi:hypothetical protein
MVFDIPGAPMISQIRKASGSKSPHDCHHSDGVGCGKTSHARLARQGENVHAWDIGTDSLPEFSPDASSLFER